MKDPYFNIPAISNSFLGQVRREIMGEKGMNQNLFSPLRDGDAIHKLILEPQNFDFRKYSGPERMKFMKIANAVHPYALLLDGEHEVQYQYDYLGWKCKLKADVVNPNDAVTDVKTTRWATQREFIQSTIDYDYNRQGAWYLDAPPIRALNINTFRILAVCKIFPHPVFVWEMERDNVLLEAGRDDYNNILDMMSTMDKYSHLKINTNE